MLTHKAQEIEHSLRARKAPESFPQELAAEFVFPDYAGRSLANVPATIAELLRSPIRGIAPPLQDVYWQSLSQRVRRVVLVLLDALGYLQLGQMLQQEPDCVWGRLARRGLLLPMTSICPSTTATALATLMTGTEPIVHGLLGYELWLREYGVLAEMLAIKPVFGTGQETLLDWGFKPETFLPVPGLGTLLAQEDVSTTTLIRDRFRRGALTRICYRGFHRIIGYTDAADMWVQTRRALARDHAERSFYFVYWGGIDSAIHANGSGGGVWQSRFHEVSRAFEEWFLDKLSSEERQDTLLIMCADHGFVDSPLDQAHDADTDPIMQRHLLIPYSGESRAAYLHCMGGDGDTVLNDL